MEDKAAGLSVHRGDIVIAPGSEHTVSVGWESPVSGTLEIQGSFEHVQSSGGIAWYVERGPQPNAEADRGFEPVPLASGQSVFGTESQKGSFTVEGQKVAVGEFVYFIVDARADGTPAPHPGDGTRLDVTITVRESDGRCAAVYRRGTRTLVVSATAASSFALDSLDGQSGPDG